MSDANIDRLSLDDASFQSDDDGSIVSDADESYDESIETEYSYFLSDDEYDVEVPPVGNNQNGECLALVLIA